MTTIKSGARPTNESGSSIVQALILVAVLALGGSVGIAALRQAIREKLQCTGDAIATLTPGTSRCGADGRPLRESGVADRGSTPPSTEGGPEQGPPLEGGQIEVLPFPGSVSVTCTG